VKGLQLTGKRAVITGATRAVTPDEDRSPIYH
jgi:hypothetical protein